jgi:hypothetical protein
MFLVLFCFIFDLFSSHLCLGFIPLHYADILRNSLTLSQTVDKIDYFSLCVLVASLSGSLIGIFAVILRQLELLCSINADPGSFRELTDGAVPMKRPSHVSWGAANAAASGVELVSFVAPPKADEFAVAGRMKPHRATTDRGSVQAHNQPWFGVDRAFEYAPLPSFFTGAQNLTMPSYQPRRYETFLNFVVSLINSNRGL